MASINTIKENLNNSVKTPRGKSVLIFSVFLVISAILWMVLTLNEDNQVEISCQVRLTNAPDSVTIISSLPEDITTTVQATNATLLKYMYGDKPVIEIDFNQFANGNRVIVQSLELKSLIRNRLGANTKFSTVTPDSLSVLFTTRPPVKLPVSYEGIVNVDSDFILSGEITVKPDSVLVFSVEPLSSRTHFISTEAVRLNHLTETTEVKVQLMAPRNSRVSPSQVTVNIPIEPLVDCTLDVPIEIAGVPSGVDAVPFPANASIIYKVPESMVDSIPDFEVVANYSELPRPTKKGVPYRLGLHLNNEGDIFHNVVFYPDSVECILDR